MTIAVANVTNTSSFSYWIARTNELATAMSVKVVTVDSNATTGNAIVNGTFQANTVKADTILANGSVISITSNIALTQVLSIGNSTVNTVINSTSMTVDNLDVDSVVTINSTGTFVGANIDILTTGIFIGNSTVNTSINSTSVVIDTFIANSTTIVVGNSTVNTVANSSTIRISGNLQVNSSVFTVGNSTVNVFINSSSISVSGQALVPYSVNSQIAASTTIVDTIAKATYRGAEYVVTITNNGANGYQMSKLLVMHDGSATDAQYNEYGVITSNGSLGTFSANANSTFVKLYLTLAAGIANVQIKAYRTAIPI